MLQYGAWFFIGNLALGVLKLLNSIFNGCHIIKMYLNILCSQ